MTKALSRRTKGLRRLVINGVRDSPIRLASEVFVASHLEAALYGELLLAKVKPLYSGNLPLEALGSKILNKDQIDLDELLGYLDRQALFAGQWQMRRARKQPREEYELLIQEKAEPVLEDLINKVKREKLLQPAVAYGYFPCGRDQNSLVVFDDQANNILGRFDLPRQRGGKGYCIADFYQDLDKGRPVDVIPMQAVTMGEQATEFSQKLFKADAYSDYLYFHGFAVQMAEALAEWTHARIRSECGFSAEEPEQLRDVLAQRYRGCRFSFGYPACPNVADSRQQLEMLNAERIGLSMDSSDQLHPEQHHSPDRDAQQSPVFQRLIALRIERAGSLKAHRSVLAEGFHGLDHFLLKAVECIGITEINTLTGCVLGEFLEMEGPFPIGQELNGRGFPALAKSIAEGKKCCVFGELPIH